MNHGGARRDNRIRLDATGGYSERIDVRSPSEFAEDHLPDAENHPVLSDDERRRVGLLHAHESEFAAKRAGAAIIARNIASMIEGAFAAKPRDWAPLVYCWRGGQRSRALTHILNEIGWRAVQLDGGYRTYRRYVVGALETLPAKFRYEVVCGLTGSGKSALIAALASEGAQVLDLEALARHRGSLLGDLPEAPQPTQKSFDSALIAALESFDPARAVYVESESKRIGAVQLPDSLLSAMRNAECIRVQLSTPLRVELLKRQYGHFLLDRDSLTSRLAHLVPLHGKQTVDRWTAAAEAGDWDLLVDDLLRVHYDPLYLRSLGKNFPRSAQAIDVAPTAITETAFRTLAREVDAAALARS